MAYSKNTWSSNDLVTALKLNNMEQGIENAQGRKWLLTITTSDWIEDTTNEVFNYQATLNGIAAADWVDVTVSSGLDYVVDDISWDISSNTIIFTTKTVPTGTINMEVAGWGVVNNSGAVVADGNFPDYDGDLNNINLNSVISTTIANSTIMESKHAPNTGNFIVVTRVVDGLTNKTQVALGNDVVYMRSYNDGAWDEWYNSEIPPCLVLTLENVSASNMSFDETNGPANITNVTADMVVVESQLSNPSVQAGEWTITTGNKTVEINGDIASSGTTDLVLYLEHTAIVRKSGIISELAHVNEQINALQSGIAIIVDGNQTTHTGGAAIGEFVLVRNSTISGITDGLYTAAQAILANTAIDSTYLTAVPDGGFNSLSDQIGYLKPIWFTSVDYLASDLPTIDLPSDWNVLYVYILVVNNGNVFSFTVVKNLSNNDDVYRMGFYVSATDWARAHFKLINNKSKIVVTDSQLNGTTRGGTVKIAYTK